MQLGVSSKAALIRQGTKETALFCKLFDRTGNHKVIYVFIHLCSPPNLILQTETMLLSCGIADIIATCFGGRNRKCGKEFAERILAKRASAVHDGEECNGDQNEQSSAALWEDIETELLGGQKLQGVDTCKEVARCLQATGHLDTPGQFPLFRRIHNIACRGHSLDSLFLWD